MVKIDQIGGIRVTLSVNSNLIVILSYTLYFRAMCLKRTLDDKGEHLLTKEVPRTSNAWQSDFSVGGRGLTTT